MHERCKKCLTVSRNRGERPRGILLGCRWKDRHNIKMVLNGICPDYVDWIAVASIG